MSLCMRVLQTMPHDRVSTNIYDYSAEALSVDLYLYVYLYESPTDDES